MFWTILLLRLLVVRAFQQVKPTDTSTTVCRCTLKPFGVNDNINESARYGAEETGSRRDLLSQSIVVATGVLIGTGQPLPANAAESVPKPQRKPLKELLYTILRVREATSQESRLIKSGKFKDVQRANVKLAVKFMVQNYRFADTFIAACTYLEGGTSRRIEAGQVGQAAVQNLITITEYFDSSDVQNIKVRTSVIMIEAVLRP